MLGKKYDEKESFITEPFKCSCTVTLFTDSCKASFDAHVVSLCSCLVLPAWASVGRLERINIILIGEQIQGAHHSLHGEGKGCFHIRTSTRLVKHWCLSCELLWFSFVKLASPNICFTVSSCFLCCSQSIDKWVQFLTGLFVSYMDLLSLTKR